MIQEQLHESKSKHTPTRLRRMHTSLRERDSGPTPPWAMLYLRPVRYAETSLEFYSFDANYIDSLCAGDHPTQKHFVGYFSTFIQLKLRSRLRSAQDVEDLRQETFARVLKALRTPGALRQPERLGAFVNTVCNNVLFEHYRSTSRTSALDEEGQPELPSTDLSPFGQMANLEIKEIVAEILTDLDPHDRRLLKALFLEERDRDEVCREFGVEREYLRVLLYRAKQAFKAKYLKRMGDSGPMGTNPWDN